MTAASASVHSFEDGDAYERFMGCWSQAVAATFLPWLAAPPGAAWLDVGCGTGAFTEMVLERAAPSFVLAIDPSPAQMAFATRRMADPRVTFRVGDAQALPFADGSFDVVCAALVLNFVPDPSAALAEMRRVARRGALVAAYVWDFEAELSPSGPLRTAMRRVGLEVPAIPGTDASTMAAFTALFAASGLQDVATRRIEARAVFRDFADYWQAQTPSYSPTTAIIDRLAAGARIALIQALRESLPAARDGSITYKAWAHAIRARSPAA